MTDNAATLRRLARIHRLRRLRAKRDTLAAATRVTIAAREFETSTASVATRQNDARQYAARAFAGLTQHTDFEVFLSTLALQGVACRRALSDAEAKLSASQVTLNDAQTHRRETARERIRIEARADKIEALARTAHKDAIRKREGREGEGAMENARERSTWQA
ncbi:MAG: hypothetical protein AAF919_12470 [Pseudomonadota bacterium]